MYLVWFDFIRSALLSHRAITAVTTFPSIYPTVPLDNARRDTDSVHVHAAGRFGVPGLAGFWSCPVVGPVVGGGAEAGSMVGGDGVVKERVG